MVLNETSSNWLLLEEAKSLREHINNNRQPNLSAPPSTLLTNPTTRSFLHTLSHLAAVTTRTTSMISDIEILHTVCELSAVTPSQKKQLSFEHTSGEIEADRVDVPSFVQICFNNLQMRAPDLSTESELHFGELSRG